MGAWEPHLPTRLNVCVENNQLDCSHCFKCGGLSYTVPYCHSGNGQLLPLEQGVAHEGKNTSHYCNFCQKEEKDVNFKRYSACTFTILLFEWMPKETLERASGIVQSYSECTETTGRTYQRAWGWV